MATNTGKDQPVKAAERTGDSDIDVSIDEVQANMDEITDKGYQGERTDPTPLENYTVSGVTSGAPTPETDEKAAEDARSAIADASTRASGPSGR